MLHKEGTILSVREDLKVFDCTIRDGGLVNNYHFEDEFVKALYEMCVASGVDYMEIGKNVSPTVMSEDEYGKWNFCKEEDIRSIVGENNTNLKIATMADVGRTIKEEIPPRSESVVDMIRVATYIHQIPEALDLIEDFHAKGYETTCNIMAISKSFDDELDQVLSQVAKSNTDVIYIADSFGSFYPEQINKLTEKYLSFAKPEGKKVGIHAHNNLSLAYANTLEAMIYGTSFLDVTTSGLGRGAGNCATELLLGFLKNPKYKYTPVLKFIQDYIVPLEKELDWGCSVPYIISGHLNEHPRAAMKARDTGDTDYVKFYNKMTEEYS
jgi:4-hydroxy 2-oxovalerate aldolase